MCSPYFLLGLLVGVLAGLLLDGYLGKAIVWLLA
jgi:hypothetical protein